MQRSIVLLSALMLSACAGHDEVARVASPDGAIDAVLVESNGGAITAFWYDIYLVRHGEPWRRAHSAAWLYDAMRSEQAYGVNIVWAAADRLEAQFSQAAQTRLYQPEATVTGLPVKVVLRPGVTDTSAPPGGMLYNRPRRLIPDSGQICGGREAPLQNEHENFVLVSQDVFLRRSIARRK